jgi:hypothetical protein
MNRSELTKLLRFNEFAMSGGCKHKDKLQMYKSTGTGNQGQPLKRFMGNSGQRTSE